ncbi:MAG TPA: hypothetical protein EYN06_00370 [Myxococcales bacterium]|nr:hypothetical protein [Myxococcales bacterium]HIN84902.1 hypothetical protein [Myxococcales bacterium]
MSPVIYAIILLAVGVLLIGIEVAIIPGFGLVGVLGAGALLYGAFIAYQNYGSAWGFAAIGFGAAAAGLGVYWSFKLGFTKRLVLEDQVVGDSSDLPAQAEKLVGQVGIAVSDLHPAGIARINGQRIDVVAADGEYIESGTAIEIININQNSVVIQRHLAQETTL